MSKHEINWHELKDTEIVYVEHSLLQKLLAEGVRKAGSLSKLFMEFNTPQIYHISRGKNGISVKNLKRMLEYANIPLEAANDKILEIRKGNKSSIETPKFPINLRDPKIGFLIGHLVSDGCLYYDNSRKNLIRTKYCSDKQENIQLFSKNLNEVFGKVHYNMEYQRHCYMIRIGTGTVGELFRKAGVPVGKKYALNSDLPWVVKEGNNGLKRQYLSAIFDDEGCVGTAPLPYLILSRNIHVPLNPDEIDDIEKYIVPLMKQSFFPTNHQTKRIAVRKLKEALLYHEKDKLLHKIMDSKPRILVAESLLLKEEFAIDNSTYVMSFQQTPNKNYSVQTSLVIRKKEAVLRFYENIGFNSSEKQNKLKEALLRSGRLKENAQTVQHPCKENRRILPSGP